MVGVPRYALDIVKVIPPMVKDRNPMTFPVSFWQELEKSPEQVREFHKERSIRKRSKVSQAAAQAVEMRGIRKTVPMPNSQTSEAGLDSEARRLFPEIGRVAKGGGAGLGSASSWGRALQTEGFEDGVVICKQHWDAVIDGSPQELAIQGRDRHAAISGEIEEAAIVATCGMPHEPLVSICQPAGRNPLVNHHELLGVDQSVEAP